MPWKDEKALPKERYEAVNPGKLPAKRCPKGCGRTACVLPLAGTRHWVALEPKPDQTAGEYAVAHGEARRLRPGERSQGYAYRTHSCATKPEPLSHQPDLFAPTPTEPDPDAPTGLLGALEDQPTTTTEGVS